MVEMFSNKHGNIKNYDVALAPFEILVSELRLKYSRM